MKMKTAMKRITVTAEVRNATRRKVLSGKRIQELAADTLRQAKAAPGEYGFSLLFAGEREMTDLNRRYLGRSGSTDVISFPEASSGPMIGKDVARPLGDIAVCLPRAAQQAGEYGHGLQDELELLLVHGLLHLLAYDHEVDQGEMEKLQNLIIKNSKLKRQNSNLT